MTDATVTHTARRVKRESLLATENTAAVVGQLRISGAYITATTATGDNVDTTAAACTLLVQSPTTIVVVVALVVRL